MSGLDPRRAGLRPLQQGAVRVMKNAKDEPADADAAQRAAEKIKDESPSLPGARGEDAAGSGEDLFRVRALRDEHDESGGH